MKKFIAVVTSMAMAASLLTACGSNAASTETTTAAASEAASEKETAGKEAEESEPAAETAGPDSNISVYVAPGGSGVGVSAAIDGTADFGMLARDIKDSEIEALGEHYQDFVVAKDALTVSVNAENPICGIMDDMPVETIRQIFAGEIATWDQVDSTLPAEAINVYIRDLSGGAYEVFQKSVMGDSEVTASATQSASMTELATNRLCGIRRL